MEEQDNKRLEILLDNLSHISEQLRLLASIALGREVQKDEKLDKVNYDLLIKMTQTTIR